MMTNTNTTASTVSLLSRRDARAVAFEMIDALGAAGAVRFHEFANAAHGAKY